MDIKNYIQKSIDTKSMLLNNDTIIDKINEVSQVIINAYKNNNKVLTAGNGGSAADAQHIAGELVVKFFKNRSALNAISLETNPSILTAIGNDLGYEDVFARQINANAQKGDVFIAISTSGNSKNMINAIKEANKIGVISVGIIGDFDCEMAEICNYVIKIPSVTTPIIQESQIMVGHIICALVEEGIFG